MKFSYAQEMFLRMCATSFIILIAILFLTSCDGITDEECEEIAKIDYNMNNPECYGWPVTERNCKCYNIICKELSCIKSPPIEFDSKEKYLKED